MMPETTDDRGRWVGGGPETRERPRAELRTPTPSTVELEGHGCCRRGGRRTLWERLTPPPHPQKYSLPPPATGKKSCPRRVQFQRSKKVPLLFRDTGNTKGAKIDANNKIPSDRIKYRKVHYSGACLVSIQYSPSTSVLYPKKERFLGGICDKTMSDQYREISGRKKPNDADIQKSAN